MTDYYDEDGFTYRPPIRTDQGIKARARRGAMGKRWWSARWIAQLEALSDDGGARLSRGRSYARKGQVLSLEETRRGIRAMVQGSRPRPYRVTIELSHHPQRLREAVISALARESGFLAQLLSGDLPEGIEDVFSGGAAPLLPSSEDDLSLDCDCPDPMRPCKHIAAAHYLLAERLDDDPFLLLRLRGWDGEEFLRDLRLRLSEAGREGQPEAEAGAGGAGDGRPEIAEGAIDDDLQAFWRAGRALGSVHPRPLPPPVPLPVLRRLGQPDFVEGDIARLLGPAIARAGEVARRLARGEPETGVGGGS